MSLQDQGFRYILRLVGHSVDGRWVHPTMVQPTDRDVTDLTDDELANAIYDMEDDALGGKPDSEF